MSNDKETNETITVNQAFGQLHEHLVRTDDDGDVHAGWTRLRRAIIDHRTDSDGGKQPSTGAVASQRTPTVVEPEAVLDATGTPGITEPTRPESDGLVGVMVRASGHIGPQATMPEAYRAIRQQCAAPRLIGDIATDLGWPVSRLRVLVDEMAELGLVVVHTPGPIRSKILIVGGPGTGKTTLVISASDLVCCSEPTDVSDPESSPADSPGGEVEFGRINLAHDLVLYLFATPSRYVLDPAYDEMIRGAIGALVLVDPQHLEDSFPAIDYFQLRGIPYAVAINTFDHAQFHPLSDIREALAVGDEVPILQLDPRQQHSAKQALAALTEHALRRVLSEQVADDADTAHTQARVLVSLQAAAD